MKTLIKILLISVLVINLFAASNFTLGQTTATNSANELCKDPATCPVKSITDVYNILGKIVWYTYTIFFIVAIFCILLAAFSFLTARGDPQKIISARTQILWAAVAIAIAILSYSASTIIKSILNSGSPSPVPGGTPTIQFDKKPYI